MFKLSKNAWINLWIAGILSLAIICRMIVLTWNGNDKSILIIIFFYPILITLNLIISLILNWLKKDIYKAYGIITVALILLALPVMIIASSK